MALLTSTRCYRRDSGAAPQESINDGPKTQQVFEGTNEWWTLWKIVRGFEIRPSRWNQRFASIGQDQHKPQLALPIGMPQNLQRLTFKRMMWTNDIDVTRELVEVGSVWWFSFDTVRHHIVPEKVVRRVDDEAVLWLLKLLLNASGKQGVPQGGVITPLTQKVTFQFERVVTGWRESSAVLDLRLKQ
jgi:hypothetical protein